MQPPKDTIGPRTHPCMKEEKPFGIGFYFEICLKVTGSNSSSKAYFMVLIFKLLFKFPVTGFLLIS